MSIIAPDRFVLTENDKGVTPIEFEIANFGSNPVRGVQVSVSAESVDFSKDYQYYGTFEKDDNDNFSADVTTAETGDFPGKITVKYMDSFNNERAIEKPLPLFQRKPPPRQPNPEKRTFSEIFRIVFGIGA